MIAVIDHHQKLVYQEEYYLSFHQSMPLSNDQQPLSRQNPKILELMKAKPAIAYFLGDGEEGSLIASVIP